GPSGRVSIAEVIDQYQVELKQHPADIQLSTGLADLLRKKYDVLPARLRDSAILTADSVINRMVEGHDQDPEAYLARYRYRLAYKIDGAEEDLAQAHKLAPDNVEVLLAAAQAAAASDREAARTYGTQLLSTAPEDRRTYLTMAAIYAGWNQPEEAIEILKA